MRSTITPAHFVPPLPDNLHLEFHTGDESKTHSALEGDLKCTLLKSLSSTCGKPASGAVSNAVVHGASGMAGVGKTTSLIALGHDDYVRSGFFDGVLFMTLGADACVKTITAGLAEIMKFTGVNESDEAVRNEFDVKNAVNGAALWFQGKCNLFLIDDIWRTSSCYQGYLQLLRRILTGSTLSRVIVTTRNREPR